MILSMTGYGKTTKNINNKKINIEIKTLNSKNLNIITKLPEQFNNKDIKIRNILTKELKGGKISFILTYETDDNNTATLNKEKINAYYKEIAGIARQNNLNPETQNIFQAILKMPDIINTGNQEENPDEWNKIEKTILETISQIQKFRKQEGKALEKDITQNIKKIQKLIPEIEKFEKERIEKVKNKLKTKLKEIKDENNIDKDRFEQEIIYYIDKLDINEEKIRLENHCKYFLQTIKQKKPAGNKLGFISQEIGREINTLGSKANHSEIQKIVVNMKEHLGKIKEQILNIL